MRGGSAQLTGRDPTRWNEASQKSEIASSAVRRRVHSTPLPRTGPRKRASPPTHAGAHERRPASAPWRRRRARRRGSPADGGGTNSAVGAEDGTRRARTRRAGGVRQLTRRRCPRGRPPAKIDGSAWASRSTRRTSTRRELDEADSSTLPARSSSRTGAWASRSTRADRQAEQAMRDLSRLATISTASTGRSTA